MSMAMPFREGARAGARLAVVVALTSARILGLRVRQALGDSPHCATRQAQRWARQLIHWLGVELQVTGRPPEGGPLLLVANHRSYMDIPLVLAHAACAFLPGRAAAPARMPRQRFGCPRG
jgi:1-acyl-sn-glycerol-3-phosphate acyltransferase